MPWTVTRWCPRICNGSFMTDPSWPSPRTGEKGTCLRVSLKKGVSRACEESWEERQGFWRFCGCLENVKVCRALLLQKFTLSISRFKRPSLWQALADFLLLCVCQGKCQHWGVAWRTFRLFFSVRGRGRGRRRPSRWRRGWLFTDNRGGGGIRGGGVGVQAPRGGCLQGAGGGAKYYFWGRNSHQG